MADEHGRSCRSVVERGTLRYGAARPAHPPPDTGGSGCYHPLLEIQAYLTGLRHMLRFHAPGFPDLVADQRERQSCILFVSSPSQGGQPVGVRVVSRRTQVVPRVASSGAKTHSSLLCPTIGSGGIAKLRVARSRSVADELRNHHARLSCFRTDTAEHAAPDDYGLLLREVAQARGERAHAFCCCPPPSLPRCVLLVVSHSARLPDASKKTKNKKKKGSCCSEA